MGVCLPTQTDSLIRLTLATLAADDHGDINVKVANVSNLNNVVNWHLGGVGRWVCPHQGVGSQHWFERLTLTAII